MNRTSLEDETKKLQENSKIPDLNFRFSFLLELPQVLKTKKKSGKWGLGCWANKLCPLLSTVLRGKALSLDAISGEAAIWVKSYQSAENFGAFEEERRNETRASTISCGN